MSIRLEASIKGHGLSENTGEMVNTFSALGDPTRLAIITRLLAGEMALSDLASPMDMSLTAVSKHVSVLEKAGLVGIEKRGRTRYCRIRMAPFKEAVTWLQDCEQFWSQNFDKLAKHLDEPEN